MNKVSLLTIGKKLQDENLYVLSIYDLEPSGLIVHAYDQIKSKEYVLPISELELTESGISRNTVSLSMLLESVKLVPQGDSMILQSTIETIRTSKKRLVGDSFLATVNSPMQGSSTSLNDLLVTALVELCKVKPVGIDAVQWLGEWLINNNPNKPAVLED